MMGPERADGPPRKLPLSVRRRAMSSSLPAPVLPKPATEEKTKRQPPYNVVLLDDDDHTFEYVITMLQQLFGYPREKGFQMANEVHNTGRCIVLTTTKEHA